MYRNPARRALLFALSLSLLGAAARLSADVLVVGTAKDDSGHGWPLYARLVVAGEGFPGATTFTDPATGYYSVSLPAGTFDFTVEPLTPGYVAGGGPVTVGPAAVAAGAQVVNWKLAAAPTCAAPGYGAGAFSGPLALSESFDSGAIPAGWSVATASGVSWKVYTGGDPCGQFDGNQTGGSGPYAIVNSGCETQFTQDDTFLESPPIDLTAYSSAALQWANDFVDLQSGSTATVEVSADAGANWQQVWQATTDQPGPGNEIADISFAAGHPSVIVRFHYQGFFSYWWQVDDVRIGTFSCAVVPGGLVVGSVVDANNGEGLNGATVSNVPGGATTLTVPTPDDPAQPDGFYTLFADGGAQTIEASYPKYATGSLEATVVPNAATRLDFELAAGRLTASPRPLSALVAPDSSQALTLTIGNDGTLAGGWSLRELDAPTATEAGVGVPSRVADPAKVRAALHRVPFQRLTDLDQTGIPAPAGAPAPGPQLAGSGQVIHSFPTNLAAGRGLVYDTRADRLWIANPDNPNFGLAGDGLEHQFTAEDGTDTGETIDIHQTGGEFQADGTFNARTGMLWQVNVGGDNCLFEMDPVAKVVTGAKLCGPWASVQRGVAFDDATNTYYVGGSNEATVYHIDAAGQLIDSAYVGLGIQGLAYNPTTHHLFVMSEGGPWDVWVLEPANGYETLGGFRVTNAGVPVLGQRLSLEANCAGRLFVNDLDASTVFEFESGETGWCIDQISWLSEDPDHGTVEPSATQPVTVTFDSHGLLPGLRQASLIVDTDTPTDVAALPVAMTVLFQDVPQDSFAWNFIYGAAGSGVMPGCAPQAPSFTFCPSTIVTRRSMAGFIERAMHGAATPPPVYLGGFQDVLAGSFNANYIQGLSDDGITSGCSVEPSLYCPESPVTRAQMAVFVWRAQHGDEAPPPCAPPGVFADVACPGAFAVDYIEGIAAEGVTSGCGNGNYCPNDGISNAQMAVFLVKAFDLPYLP